MVRPNLLKSVQDSDVIIGIDYTAALKQSGGIGRYTCGLVNALAQIDSTNQYRLLHTPDSPTTDLSSLLTHPNIQVQVYPLAERWMTIGWHRARLPVPVEWLVGQLDLFHSPNFILPPVQHATALLTVHDLSFIRYPEGAVPNLRQWLNNVVPRSMNRADHILADSHNSKQDIIEIYGIAAEKITVVGAGVDTRFQPSHSDHQRHAVRERYRLPERFVLGLGTLEPRKNFVGLINAFSQSAIRESHHLVIGGGKGWLYDEIFQAAAESPVSERIHLIGFVADHDLPVLYTLADLFAYPSHYEGFGIPVLEAMGCGTPVVCADNSSIPEVAGDAAWYVSAGDTEHLAHTLNQAITDNDQRQAMINRGFEQIKKFDWQISAQRLLDVYQSVV